MNAARNPESRLDLVAHRLHLGNCCKQAITLTHCRVNEHNLAFLLAFLIFFKSKRPKPVGAFGAPLGAGQLAGPAEDRELSNFGQEARWRGPCAEGFHAEPRPIVSWFVS